MLRLFGVSESTAAQSSRGGALSMERADAFMALFGLRFPIVQAPAGGPELAAAISNAGGLGREGDVVATHAKGTTVLRYATAAPSRGLEGAVTDMAMYAGEGVGEVKDIPLVRDLLGRIRAECLGG